MVPLRVIGPAVELRLAGPEDAPALFALGRDPEVTRFFSWGPYERLEQAEAYVARLPAERAEGRQLDLLVAHRERGVAGVTGLSELSRRDRRCVVGSWLGRDFWGTGVNSEAKALVAHLVFAVLGHERLGAYAAPDNPRSQRALEKLGWRREGTLRRFHRHGDVVHDVHVFGLLRDEWERSPLAGVPVRVEGDVPVSFA
jgi:[ribosomal protein S5]-alanine N-acetyltransferase